MLAALVTGGVVITSGTPQSAATTHARPVSTAKVSKGELVATIAQTGTLSYRAQPDGSPYSVINRASGTFSQLPAVGQVVRQGHVLYRVSGSPVVLLYGSTPAYRTLANGSTGADVAELNADLVTIDYATRAQLSPSSDSFGSATAAALDKLQAAVGLPQTGTLPLGQAVFEPGALRVTSVQAQLGGNAPVGQTVLVGTSTSRQVQLSLNATQQTDVSVGDKLMITLPNNHTTPGVVSSVGAVATCPSGGSSSSSSSAASGSDACSSGGSTTATPTITVDVTPTDPAATGTWDQAPVKVAITTARVRQALSVPVASLLAQSGGGYSVEVVGAGGSRRLVPVSLGLFDDADGLVQVTSSGLAAGQKVVVPST